MVQAGLPRHRRCPACQPGPARLVRKLVGIANPDWPPGEPTRRRSQATVVQAGPRGPGFVGLGAAELSRVHSAGPMPDACRGHCGRGGGGDGFVTPTVKIKRGRQDVTELFSIDAIVRMVPAKLRAEMMAEFVTDDGVSFQNSSNDGGGTLRSR